jgi:prepilin-type N-terminal cleavage/methylation domain-containing protein/prepilin-type processing-associated H-X9-DG protein
MTTQRKNGVSKGFTLVELLVVITIIGILVALLLPAVQAAREAAHRMQCGNNMKQMALGCMSFEAAYKIMPPGNRAVRFKGSPSIDNASWIFHVLPYIDQNNLYDQVLAAGNMTNAVNQNILPIRLPMGRCPSDGWNLQDKRLHNYVGCTGPQCNNPPPGCPAPFQMYCNACNTATDVPAPLSPPWAEGYGPSFTWGNTNNISLVRGMFSRGDPSSVGAVINPSSVTDGLSNTILLGEILPEFAEYQRYGVSIGWAGYNTVSQGQTIQPINWTIEDVSTDVPYMKSCSDCSDPEHCLWNWAVTWGFKSNHSGGANFAMADGSSHFISETIDHRLYQYLGCRDDDQPAMVP